MKQRESKHHLNTPCYISIIYAHTLNQNTASKVPLNIEEEQWKAMSYSNYVAGKQIGLTTRPLLFIKPMTTFKKNKEFNRSTTTVYIFTRKIKHFPTIDPFRFITGSHQF